MPTMSCVSLSSSSMFLMRGRLSLRFPPDQRRDFINIATVIVIICVSSDMVSSTSPENVDDRGFSSLFYGSTNMNQTFKLTVTIEARRRVVTNRWGGERMIFSPDKDD